MLTEPRPDEAAPAHRRRPSQRDRLAGLLGRLNRTDRDVLGWWAVTRAGVLIIALSAPLLFNRGNDYPNVWRAWKQWDTWHFEAIAVHGYDAGEPSGAPLAAFFPGLPMLMRMLSWFGLDPVAAGVVVSLVASAVAGISLARLGQHEFPGLSRSGKTDSAYDVGPVAALMWFAAPVGVFLAAAYTEALFCALAFPAWLAARQGRWTRASVLVALACTVRVSGIFLAVALVVEFLTSRKRDWKALPWLAAPAVPLAAFMAYLHRVSGDWLAWQHAQEKGWQREGTWPWKSLKATIDAASKGHFDASRTDWTWMFRGELVALAVGLAVLVWLLLRRSWGEATWVGTTLTAFVTSEWIFSLTRATLLWWPLWIGLAVLHQRRPWLSRLYLAMAIPLAAAWAAAFFTGRWSG